MFQEVVFCDVLCYLLNFPYLKGNDFLSNFSKLAIAVYFYLDLISNLQQRNCGK